jgi:nucleoside 2-deoxyribosyltransferase
LNRHKVYFASGWFTKNQIETYSTAKKILDSHKELDVFYPKEKSSELQNKLYNEKVRLKIFNDNLDGIEMSDFIVCSTEDKDTGSIFESGYAYSINKKIVFINFHLKSPFNLMLQKACIAIAKTPIQFEMILRIISEDGINSKLLEKFNSQKKVE